MRARILFLGLDHWTRHLADGLNERFPERAVCHAVGFDDMRSGLLRPLWLTLLATAVVRVGFPPLEIKQLPESAPARSAGMRGVAKSFLFRFRVGRWLRRAVLITRAMRTRKSADYRIPAMDLAFRLSARLRPRRSHIYYWVGTDVLQAAERAQSRVVSRAGVGTAGRARNIAGARHLAAELETLGINAETVSFPGDTVEAPATCPPFPARFRVASYVPASRFDFYGGTALLAAARRLPEIEFLIMANDGEAVRDAPENVTFLGWVDDPATVYRECVVLIRMVEHDAVGATVSEALRFCRYVVYSLELPHTIHVRYGDEDTLVSLLLELSTAHADGRLPLNTAGREWAVEEFDVDRRFAALFDALRTSPGGG